MEFKQLVIKSEWGWMKRMIRSPHTRKSLIYIVLGATVGFLYFFFTEGKHMEVMPTGEIIRSLLIGGFFGFFITNSPCARGRC